MYSVHNGVQSDYEVEIQFRISLQFQAIDIMLVSKELNHLAAILHVYAWILIFMKSRKDIIIFQKEKGNTFTLLIIFIVKSLQKEQNSTNLLL